MRIRHALAALFLVAAGAAAQDALRPEVGKPLQAAQELIKAQKYKEALAKVRDAEAVPNKSAGESYLVERMRIAAASGAGDAELAAKSFEALKASGRLPAAEQLRMLESLAGSFYRAKDYPRTIVWGKRYLAEGGTNAQIRMLVIQSQYLSGDYAGAAKELVLEVQADDKAGRATPEDRLTLLLNAAQRANDAPAQAPWSACSGTTRSRRTGPTRSRACSASPASAIAWRSTPTA
jgi:hypothetical protein